MLACVCGRARPSRKEVASALRLRPVSVGDAVAELLSQGLLREGTEVRSPGRRGRPEIILETNWDRAVAIAIHVESRDLRGALVNWSGGVIAEQTVPVAAAATRAAFVDRLRFLIAELSRRRPPGSDLLGASLALVGTVDARRKKWVSSARWPGVSGLDLAALEQSLGMKLLVSRVLDVELADRIARLADDGRGQILLFHWGYGIGAAYAHAGKVLSSTLGRFGEIGHTRLGAGANKRCPCGGAGCLETEAALWALLPALNDLPAGRAASAPVPDTEAGIVEFLRRTDVVKSQVIQRALGHVQMGLLNIYEILHPDRILLIGPFIEIAAIRERLVQGFRDALPAYARNAVEITWAQGGFRGCTEGGTRPMFQEWLQQRMKERT